jgi:alkanesulfonate monooxygenase SsuD/methylene tetrahydromethanopterin reductase-like flavin-dependent oxidoreductase (luciferase family)
MDAPRLGITFVPTLPPERLRSMARAAEDSGLDELWVWEDCFRESGVATAAAALAWTERIVVGVGLLPVPLRNVALTAMEIATLDRMFPGRLLAGLGHGVQPWMQQVGARVESPMTLLREYTVALRRLLDGERVSTRGRYVTLDDVALDWPPTSPPRLLLGGAGPKSLRMAGELGDGTLLSSALTEDEIRTACELALEGARAAEVAARRSDDDHGSTGTASNLDGPAVGTARGEPHDIVATLICATGPGAQQRVDGEVAIWGRTPGAGIAGDAATVADTVLRLASVGCTSVAALPTQDEPDLDGLSAFLGRKVRPLLHAAS